MAERYINVIGAGLAGCEAAWQAAKRGVQVRLFEMKPKKYTPAHKMDFFAELVCSNSLRSDSLTNAVGLLKEEMRRLDSIIMKCADETRLPAGGALAVDREGFSKAVTKAVKDHPNVIVYSEEVTSLPEDGITVVATGPLTSDAFAEHIMKVTGRDSLYFYDAAAPIVTYESIDMTKAFRASRYGKGTDDYINCPMDREQYELFWNELVNAETVPIRDFEKMILFSGCMPVESMAANGRDTLRFGPLKPVGIIDPATGKEPYAVVQLRQDNKAGTLYNMVGFQTHLRWPEQKRVFRLIPGLENAEFIRYGVMHRNIYIDSPGLIDPTYRMRSRPELYFAGQITGVEGYVESASSGLVAGINAARQCLGESLVIFPENTAIGSLAAYVSGNSVGRLQPMNASFGLIRAPEQRIRNKNEKHRIMAEIALDQIEKIKMSEKI
ncbi:MAG TPA: methylenetetrahydrofolate--tRNA-(uracil(54)-C(5))-methyltransferase (FADH(2)-oxidizing) TrmFO [Clostridiales bacterium]|nr:methylenetetrahydrofolate--tRNA-(uracil(54)-C(5))-methyltransferase (FADH(2)-oxidizing) TrmFO [Clostridiales bacterium]HPP35402.1 methylenetetrahydrofolate--tRNA-(uracil(54)-C(5))-methyltransferase (FADH(2)-oxidizing) TrmFO [Clostridiales bacterium]